MEKYYGETGLEAGRAFCRSLVSIGEMAEHFPMTAWAVQNALAVVVHTDYAREVVRRATDVPVFTIPLPYRPQANPEQGRVVHFSRARRARLVIFGYLNTNRRIIEFLHALATMPERDCFEVDVLGTVLHEREVRVAVELLGLREHVTFYGYVSDETLEDTLAAADLAINLRHPTMVRRRAANSASGTTRCRAWCPLGTAMPTSRRTPSVLSGRNMSAPTCNGTCGVFCGIRVISAKRADADANCCSRITCRACTWRPCARCAGKLRRCVHATIGNGWRNVSARPPPVD